MLDSLILYLAIGLVYATLTWGGALIFASLNKVPFKSGGESLTVVGVLKDFLFRVAAWPFGAISLCILLFILTISKFKTPTGSSH